LKNNVTVKNKVKLFQCLEVVSILLLAYVQVGVGYVIELQILPFHKSGVSLASGVFPICWKGLNSLLGCSTDLLNSCVQGAHAKTPPTTVRHGVPGINTYPTVSLIEAPLLNKGDTVER
jgi:hypothetical protein